MALTLHWVLFGVFGVRRFYIANPSINKLTALPTEYTHIEPFSPFNIPEAGIGFDASTGKYKAVRIFEYNIMGMYGMHRISGCEVYTLGVTSSGRWKQVGDPPFPPNRRCLTHPCNESWPQWWSEEPYIGRLDLDLETEVAVSFNLSDETFGVVLHPKGSSSRGHLWSRVAALGGCLCVADTSFPTLQMDIWVLKDYDNRRWVKQYSIRLLDMYPNRATVLAKMVLPVALRSDGTVVLYDREGSRCCYDPRTRKFAHEAVKGPLRLEQLVTYTDGLVWPWPTDACTV